MYINYKSFLQMKRRPRDTHECQYHHVTHHFERGTPAHCGVVCGVLTTFAVLCAAGLVAFGVLLFLGYTKPCTLPIDCDSRDPCAVDTCDAGWCTHRQKPECCRTSADCGGQAGCFLSYCNTELNVCQARQKSNGSYCDDDDACIVDSFCRDGKCEGKQLVCGLDNQCRHGTCDSAIGCVYTNLPNGATCDDHNACTSDDTCHNGLCAVSTVKDCSHLNTPCSVGACDVTSGACVALSIHDGEPCDDGQQCTENDVCGGGTCAGTPRTCFDNNPCTIDACVENIGCMVQHQDYGETCIPGCLTHSDCPLAYTCLDGTCLQTQLDASEQIRMLGYEIESCGNLTSRLNLHFVLDTKQFVLGNDTRYRVVRTPADIYPDPFYSPLGFGASVVNMAHHEFSTDMARSSFTIKTECQRFDETNCAYLFNNREFRFSAQAHDCTTISTPVAENCLDPMHLIHVSAHVSISSCAMFPGHVEVTMARGDGVVHYRDVFYRGEVYGLDDDTDSFQVCDDETRGVVGIETSVYNHTDSKAVITDMRVCRIDPQHYLSHCVDGVNTTSECFNRGCFDWDPLDSPLQWQMDIIVNSEVTAHALTPEISAAGCYPNDDYNANDATMCGWTKCDKLQMDDSFEFNFRPLYHLIPDTPGTFQDRVFVFDIKYKLVLCSLQRRRLLSQDSLYSMAVVKMERSPCVSD